VDIDRLHNCEFEWRLERATFDSIITFASAMGAASLSVRKTS